MSGAASSDFVVGEGEKRKGGGGEAGESGSGSSGGGKGSGSGIGPLRKQTDNLDHRVRVAESILYDSYKIPKEHTDKPIWTAIRQTKEFYASEAPAGKRGAHSLGPEGTR